MKKLLSAVLLWMFVSAGVCLGQESQVRGWTKGKGWGWIWGQDDEVGALNAMTPQTVLRALALVKQGKIYDLGVAYDRTSFKWPGHSPGEAAALPWKPSRATS